MQHPHETGQSSGGTMEVSGKQKPKERFVNGNK